jgi:nucleotidyltransferase/DNA polymerase involved in DNA repair
MRKTIDRELGYKASCGISHNKTLAKLASSQNKPNAQTVVPIRYMIKGLKEIKINDVRMCGGKVGDAL